MRARCIGTFQLTTEDAPALIASGKCPNLERWRRPPAAGQQGVYLSEKRNLLSRSAGGS